MNLGHRNLNKKNKHVGNRPNKEFSGAFLKWTKEKFRQKDQRTKTLISVHKTFTSMRWQTLYVKKR